MTKGVRENCRFRISNQTGGRSSGISSSISFCRTKWLSTDAFHGVLYDGCSRTDASLYSLYYSSNSGERVTEVRRSLALNGHRSDRQNCANKASSALPFRCVAFESDAERVFLNEGLVDVGIYKAKFTI